MSLTHHHHQFIHAELLNLQVGGRGMRKSDAQLKKPFRDRFFDLFRVVNLEIQGDLRTAHTKFAQCVGQYVLGCDDDGCEIKAADNHFS